MIDISQWRISIGLWHCRHIPCNATGGAVNSAPLWVESLFCSENRGVTNLVFSLVVFLLLLLILSGDVELNPGPLTDISNMLKEAPNHDDLLPLLADISSKWYSIGLAFKVHTNDLDSLSKGVQYDDKAKLSKVIRIWIDTQSSPVIWETVISALGGPILNNKSKVDEILQYLDLSNYFSQFGLEYMDLKTQCDDNVFIEVVRHIDDCIEVGRGLNLSSEILESMSNKPNDIESKNAVLWTWKKKKENDATYIELVKSFLAMKNEPAAKSILKYVSMKTSEGDDSTLHISPQKTYENWKELTESEQQVVRNRLMDEYVDVKKAFTFFVGQVMHSFSERKVKPAYVQALANCFFGNQKVFSFSKDDDIYIVFFELTKHCSWFNYGLFKAIIESPGNEAEKGFLKTYEDRLVTYLEHSIFEIPCSPPGNQPQRTKLVFKVSEELCLTGREVNAIQRGLARLIGFEYDTVINFEDYNDGCVELVFSLPTVILESSFTESSLFTYIDWEKSKQSCKVNIDLISLLSFSDIPEVSIVSKILQEKEKALTQVSLSLENEMKKKKTVFDESEKDSYASTNEDPISPDSSMATEEKSKNLKDLQGETKEEIITKLQTSERICKKMTLQIEQQQSDLSKQKEMLASLNLQLEEKDKRIDELTKKIEGKESIELITQEKQEDLEKLQEIITSLTLQLREKEKRNIQLMEKLKEVNDHLKTNHPQLSQKIEEGLLMDTNKEETQENILKEMPSHYDLLHLLADMKNSWYDFGLALRVSSDCLDGLLRSPDTPSTKLSNVIRNWMVSQSSPVTWKTLISAIEGHIVNNKRKANEIRDYLDLTNLLSQYGLQYEELEKECDDGLIIAVSQNIDDYIKVGRGLALSRETLESISRDIDNDIHRKNAVLWAWKIKNGNDATYFELVKAFRKMTDRFLIVSVLNYVSKKTTSKQTLTPVHLVPEMAKDIMPTLEEKRITESQKKIARLQEIISSLNLKLIEKDDMIEELETQLKESHISRTKVEPRAAMPRHQVEKAEEVSHMPDLLLDVQPPIMEIATHARTAEWHHLGTQLELNDVDLAECHNCTKMYQLWIMEKAENATRRQLISALRAIRQNNVADIYEDFLKRVSM